MSKEDMFDDILKRITEKLEESVICDICYNKLYLKNFQVKQILCIDIEKLPFETDEYDCSLKLEDSKFIIKMEKQTLVLIGIVGFENCIGPDLQRHYLAFCRSLDGKWYEYNDIECTKKAVPVKRNLKVNAALFIYIECDKYDSM